MAICPEYQQLMAGAIDGALGPEEQAEAEQHLAACSQCAMEVHELTATRRLLAALPQEETSPLFVSRLGERLAAERRGLWARLSARCGEPRLALQLAAAAAAVLLLVSALAWQHVPTPYQSSPAGVTKADRSRPGSGDPELDAFVQECIDRHESTQANRPLWQNADRVMVVADGGH